MSEDEVTIAKLRLTIKRFQEYDQKRKKYVRDLEEKYNALREEYETAGIDDLKNKIDSLTKKNAELSKRYSISKYKEFADSVKDSELVDMFKADELKRMLIETRTRNTKLKRTINDLIYKLNKKEEAQ